MFYKIVKERPDRPLDSTDIFLIIELGETDVFMEFVSSLEIDGNEDLNYGVHSLRINLEKDPVLLATMEVLFGNKDRLVFIADMKGDETKGFMIHDRFNFPFIEGEEQDVD